MGNITDISKDSEADIKRKYITPHVTKAGWDSDFQIKEEVELTKGRILVEGKKTRRQKCKRADYVLYWKANIPLAVIEAKKATKSMETAMEQALGYADMLDVPFIFTSNGTGFIFLDKTSEAGPIQKKLNLNEFPSPEVLWKKYCSYKGIDTEEQKIVQQDYLFSEHRKPRYYQCVAVNRTIEAIAKGENRILLTMATGTGKTYTAFQIVYRLWKARKKKRILFLADRNILVDDPMRKDFKFFNENSNDRMMTKIKNKQIDKEFQVYFAIYQGITSHDGFDDIYRKFSPEFFDLIIIDECHRGSAKDESNWKQILTYFTKATQVGLTATPKETRQTSNSEYFGNPIFTYSLSQGIDDGFLAPYKVIRVTLDKDVEGFRPTKGKTDKLGQEIEDREYNVNDFDKTMVIEDRTKVVAKKVSDFLKRNDDRMAKTIFFCVDIDHASRLAAELRNENADLVKENTHYVTQMTSDSEGTELLDEFMDPNEPYPVLVTTSKLLSTGVDVETCKYVVLDSNIRNMTEFKQIIGRGTRISEDYNKLYFTIIDFRQVTTLFADRNFDGEPVRIKEITEDQEIPSEDEDVTSENQEGTSSELDDFPSFEEREEDASEEDDGSEEGGTSQGRRKYYVDDVPVTILNEQVQRLDANGKLIVESIVDFTKNSVKNDYATFEIFAEKWHSSEKKTEIIKELESKGISFEDLKIEIEQDLDPFDTICHLVYDRKPLTRKERAKKVVEDNYFTKYGDSARGVLELLLEKYTSGGIENLENMQTLNVPDFQRFGRPLEIVSLFGDKAGYQKAIRELEEEIYRVS